MTDPLLALAVSLVHTERLRLGPETPLSVEAAAWYLDVSVDHVRKLVQANEIAFSRPGGKRLYFLRKDLDAYAALRRRPSRHEIEAATDWPTIGVGGSG